MKNADITSSELKTKVDIHIQTVGAAAISQARPQWTYHAVISIIEPCPGHWQATKQIAELVVMAGGGKSK